MTKSKFGVSEVEIKTHQMNHKEKLVSVLKCINVEA